MCGRLLYFSPWAAVFGVVVFLFVGSEIPAASPSPPAYAIVAQKQTAEQAPWNEVVEALRKKHSAEVFFWDDGVDALRGKLAAFGPDYVCFVARPDELTAVAKVRAQTPDGRSLELPMYGLYYHNVGELIRKLDDDPYDDAIWGVLTGRTPRDALRVVTAEPLTVRRGLSHITSGWLEWFEAGASFNECEKGQKWIKMPGKSPKQVEGPDDTTKEFVEALNSGKVDMVSSSGHATEHDWQMGFTYPNGQIVTPSKMEKLPEAARENYKKLSSAENGEHLLGVDTANNVYEIQADNPKIYYSPGNCRIARVDGTDCMALDWIHHGAMQFFGHVGLQTRSCYAWGVVGYFLELQGRFSFAESVWINQQALRWELSRMSEEDRKQKYICCRNETCFPVGGEVFWETTVFYGDPAWEARVEPTTDPRYEQQMESRQLADGAEERTFTVRMGREGKPSRPAAFLVKTPAGAEIEVKEGPKDLLVADNFVLIPFWADEESAPKVGQEYKAVVVIRKAAAGK